MTVKESFEAQLRRLEVELAELDRVIAVTQARGNAIAQRRSTTRLAAAAPANLPAEAPEASDAPVTRREVPRPSQPPASTAERAAPDEGSGRYTILNQAHVRRPASR
jgi:hypothetical protein